MGPGKCWAPLTLSARWSGHSYSSGGSCKSWALGAWCKPSQEESSQGELRIGEGRSISPGWKALCWGWALQWMCFSALPTHFDVGIFSVTQCVGVTQFFSRFLSREMDPCEIVYSVNLWEEGESGAPYLATLVSLKHCLSNNGIIASLSWFMSLFHQNFSCFHSVKSKSESVNCSVMSSCLWPQDRSPIGSSVHWILQVRILEWVASSSSRGSSQPRDLTWVFRIAGSLFTIWAIREALRAKHCVKMRRKISFGLFRTSLQV